MSFTVHYSQPSEYRFSLDSILAVQFIAQQMRLNKRLSADPLNFQVLDLCAGCGVMGFELLFHLPEIKHIDFVEVQSVYQEHFFHNKKLMDRPDTQLHWLEMNYELLRAAKYQHKYDLIICNPPYFQIGQGKLSPSEFKNRCRFFIDSTFRKLMEVIVHCLKPAGEAFVLIRSLHDHKIDLRDEMQKVIFGEFFSQKATDIRGTELIKIAAK